MKLEVRIEQRHIKQGMPERSGLCAAALAIREQHPREGTWMIGYDGAYLWPGRGYRFPEAISRWIWEFDLQNTERVDAQGRPLKVKSPKPIRPIVFTMEEMA